MDMILTGRAVDAAEALDFGLANRVVEAGTTLQTAEQLARDLSGFPQTCMRNDRLSVTQQFGQPETAAMRYEIGVGSESLAVDGTGGAARFPAARVAMEPSPPDRTAVLVGQGR